MLDTKQKFNMLYDLTKKVMDARVTYSSSYTFVENKLNDPAIVKSFESLENKLNKQLTKLRKEYLNARKS